MRLTDARIERGAGYRLDGLDATLDWAAGGGARPSMLAWSGGRLRDFDLGPARLRLALGGDGLRLIDAARLPLLDGALDVSRLEAGLSADGPRFEFDAELAPLSLEAVTTAFGWPALPGKVAGSFRRLGFAAGALRLGGEMAVEVFDGRVRVTDLVIDDLFGTLPSVRANIGVRGLSLEPLTAAFDFGAISGRLDGRVENLYLQGSRAVTFDAWLATPPASDDDLPHRISQRAVDNLTSLGGASGTLATTFLGFFESFRYARLGLGCRLANGRCEMRGVADAPEGYYIVRGAGLPRVDVVGYNRSVDWDELVRRLSAAASAEAPVVR